MPQPRRRLTPGEVVIGFLRPDGRLIGELASVAVGHDAHADTIPGVRTLLARGRAFAVTIGKTPAGEIRVFGSGTFLPPDGGGLSERLKNLARQLVE